MFIFQRRNAPGLQPLSSDYPQRCCHQAFSSLIKMVRSLRQCCLRARVCECGTVGVWVLLICSAA